MTIGQDLTWWMDIEFSQMFTEENGKKTSWWWQQFDSKKKILWLANSQKCHIEFHMFEMNKTSQSSEVKWNTCHSKDIIFFKDITVL